MRTNFARNIQSFNKIGFHYFQDTNHYTNKDLNQWLPVLQNLSASWVVLLSDSSRAIPEQFITGLVNANITPIIHFPLRLPDSPSPLDLHSILQAYAKWGVKHVVFFDKPNQMSSWSSAGWSHQDLIERFVDRFLPLAIEANQSNLTPLFPPLEPGGSYWDTSFLRASLASIKRRGHEKLINQMGFTSTTYTFGHDLNWGNGGPQKWGGSKPYFTPPESEDQRGFNNYQWVKSIIASVSSIEAPIFLFGCGLKSTSSSYAPEVHGEIIHQIINQSAELDKNTIKACIFWLLAADSGTEYYDQAWIKPDSENLPIVRILSKLDAAKGIQESENRSQVTNGNIALENPHPLTHYLLLPAYEWGVPNWHLDAARPFIQKYLPTIGFSIDDAKLAKKVTVVGGEKTFDPNLITQLRASGCVVDQISGDGTSIATLLSER
jgi:hypothetical protein